MREEESYRERELHPPSQDNVWLEASSGNFCVGFTYAWVSGLGLNSMHHLFTIIKNVIWGEKRGGFVKIWAK